jgi:hypothetical protein
MRRAILIAVVLCLSACSDVDEKRPDYWLEQYSKLSVEWQRVARVFGFDDDREGCEKIVEALATTRPKARYRCVRAVGSSWQKP